MELGFAHKNCSDLQLVLHQLDLQDTELLGTKRHMSTYKLDEYYRHLQNVALHTITEQIKIALIEGNFQSILANRRQLPEQLNPLNLASAAPELSNDEKHVTRPVIYTHFHVDRSGNPPTANE